ncbi:MAG: MFS transporter, partial [Pseudomonadales bacterium]
MLLNKNTQLSNSKLAAYSAPAIPITVFAVPFLIYAPPFFASEMGLGLATVGTIFMIARFWDLISDPLMGFLSDRIPSRWGRRRHWIVLSVPLLMIATVLVMFPNYIPGTHGNSLYVLLSLLFLYVGYTMLTISHISWGAELSEDYNERSRIQAWREFANLTAMAMVLLVPAILEQTGSAVTMQDKMNAMGWYVLCTLPPMVFIAVRNVGEKKYVKPAKVAGFKEEVRAFWENRFLRRIVIADLMIHLPTAIRGSLFVFYVQTVIGMPEWTAVIMISYFVAGPLAVPIW